MGKSRIERFEDLDVWQEARLFAGGVFGLLRNTRFEKEFRFKEQIKSSAGSIMDNIAEGFERGGNKEFAQFLYIAKGSCGEVRSQLYRALDAGLIDQQEFSLFAEKSISIAKSLGGFIKYLSETELKGVKYK